MMPTLLLPFVSPRRAVLAALALAGLTVALSARADLILYNQGGGPMQYNYQGPVAVKFTLQRARTIRAISAWVNGGQEPITIGVTSLAPGEGETAVDYSKTFMASPVVGAPAKWQGITNLNWALQPGEYSLVFDGGDYPFAYGYVGPHLEPTFPTVVEDVVNYARAFDTGLWEETQYPFGYKVYAEPFSPVPEPASYGLFAALGLGVVAWRRRVIAKT
jgi:hypothetical protein